MNITNCPNCGAPLNKRGICDYCGTVLKSPTEFNLNEQVELNIVLKQGNATSILPVIGYIDSLTIEPIHESIDCFMRNRHESVYIGTSVDFNFRGRIKEEDI